MSKITDYSAISNVQTDDLLVVVDVHDSMMAAPGTTKKMTLSQLPFDASGAATAALATAEAYTDAETTRAENAEALLASLASPALTGSPTAPTQSGADDSTKIATTAYVTGAVATETTRAEAAEAANAGAITAETSRAEAAEAALMPLPSGTPSSGQVPVATGSGDASAWGSVAVNQPWQFYVKSYGAKGDGQVVTDGAMSSSSNQTHLACATSTPFANAAAGMPVHVGGAAGSAYTPLCTTIASVTDSGHVVLSASATSTVSSAIVYFGTDDTAAIQDAVNAAATYAQAHNGYAEVIFDPLTYIIGGAPVIGGGTLGNAQIALPIIADTAQKVTLVFKGTLDQSALNHWLQTTPQAAGTVLACARNDGTVDATYGPSCVIGGPFDGYGARSSGESTWDNMCPVIDGIGIMVPYNGTYGGFDFFGMAEANVPDGACMAAAIIPASGAVPSMSSYSNIGNFGFPGLRMPSWRNNANCNIGLFSCEGIVDGLFLSEHCVFDSVRLINCYNGLIPYSGAGSVTDHYAYGSYACIEACSNAIVAPGLAGDGGCRIYFQMLDLETPAGGLVNDSSNLLYGYIGVAGVAGGVSAVTGAANLRIINLQQPSGVWGSPPSVPATTVAQQNTAWRDATVYITSGGADVTEIDVDGTATGLTLGTSGTVAVRVPSGHSVTLTYASTAPTWVWVLD